MSNYHILFGYLAVAVQIVSFSFYFWGIFKGKTKPHAFTWFVWGVLSIVGFLAVFVSGGESGSWVLAINALACFTIAVIGFLQKRVEYDKYDWMALVGALFGIFLWWITSNPLYAIILVSLSDATGAIPSLRKAYRLPYEENASAFAVGILYYPLSIIALESLTITTWLYPATIILIDALLVSLILIRRKQLKN